MNGRPGRLTARRLEFGKREILITQCQIFDPFDGLLFIGSSGAVCLFRT